MNTDTIEAFLIQIDGGTQKYIDVAYYETEEASFAAELRSEVAQFVFGHEGAHIEIDFKKRNEPNNLLKEML